MKGDFKKKCFYILIIKSPVPLFAKEGYFRVKITRKGEFNT